MDCSNPEVPLALFCAGALRQENLCIISTGANVGQDRKILTLVYSIEQDELLWAGQSETANPKDVRKFIKDLVDAAGKEMRKSGLVKK